jgi:2-keto-4-pentenoate hydratase
MPVDLTAAYAVQRLVVDGLCEAWQGKRAGYKIALTNPAAQAMLGVPHPVFGRLISSRVYASGVALRAADFVVRTIECEIGLRMGADVPRAEVPYTRESIAEFVDAACPAVEIVEFHFAGIDRVTPQSLAADNAIHGAWVKGDLVRDWSPDAIGDIDTILTVDGAIQLRGSSAKVLGHPLEALAWLANSLGDYGLALRAGDFVTTGVTTDEVYPAKPGERLAASFGMLGEVQLSFD